MEFLGVDEVGKGGREGEKRRGRGIGEGIKEERK